MPRIKATATPDFLRHLVVKAYDEARFTDSAETKTQALSGIMSDAISRTQFNVPQKTQPYPTYYAHQHQENTNLANAKAFFRACFGRFDALLDVVIAKVTDVQSLAAHEVQKHVKEVLLPMLQVVAEMIKPGADVPPSVTKLLRLVFDEYIKVMTADPKSTSRESIRALVSAATLPGGPELLMSQYVTLFCCLATDGLTLNVASCLRLRAYRSWILHFVVSWKNSRPIPIASHSH